MLPNDVAMMAEWPLAVAFSTAVLPDLGCYECQEKGLLPTVMSFR